MDPMGNIQLNWKDSEDNRCPSETGFRFSSAKKTLPSCQRRRAGFRRREPGAVEAPQSCGRRWLADSEQAPVGRGVKLAPGNPTVDGRNPAPVDR